MAVNNSLTAKKKQPPFSAVINSDGYRKMINNTLRDPKRANRFVASVISAVSVNPVLQECAPDTILSAALLGESLELSPSPQLGQFYLVPYDDKKRGCKVAQFQIGYRGYIQLAMRTDKYRTLKAKVIREGEYKGRDKKYGEPIFEYYDDDELAESMPVVGYLAWFELLNGFEHQVYFSKAKMLKHADQYSKAFSAEKYKALQEGRIPQNEMWKYSSPWYTGFDGMALKTVMRQLISKSGIVSIETPEMQRAYDADMSVVQEDGTFDYVDNRPESDETIIDVDTGEITEVQDSTGLTEEEKAAIIAAEQAAAQDDFFNN